MEGLILFGTLLFSKRYAALSFCMISSVKLVGRKVGLTVAS